MTGDLAWDVARGPTCGRLEELLLSVSSEQMLRGIFLVPNLACQAELRTAADGRLHTGLWPSAGPDR